MKKTIIILLAFIAVLGLGIYGGTKIKKTQAPAGVENSYQAGWDAAKKKLAETMPTPLGAEETKILNATIQKISGSTLTVKVLPMASNPLDQQTDDIRTVQISGDTKIYQLVQKDFAQIQKEMEEFQSKMKTQAESKDAANVESLTPPMPQDKKEVAIGDLKEGQQISITANENIKDKKEIAAAEINIQPVLPVDQANLPAAPVQNQPQAAAPTNLPASAPAPANVTTPDSKTTTSLPAPPPTNTTTAPATDLPAPPPAAK